MAAKQSVVYTVGEVCKKCYSCVRFCPTKAIEVHSGQADIIDDLCISCGICVNMCSQNAKRIRSSVEAVLDILSTGKKGASYAMVAPSFPAAFLDINAGSIVGALREAGFDGVFEVAFGADLVSYEYSRRFHDPKTDDQDGFVISSPCPAVVNFVERMHPDLVPHLARVMSPMEAMGKVLKERMNGDAKIVFIGPCVAKKDEAERTEYVDEVLTFNELLELFAAAGVDYRAAAAEEFDPPEANLGKLYPVTGGLLKAASIDSDLLASPVYVVEGQERVSDILKVLEKKVQNGEPVVNRLFDLLFCDGCIAGPAIPNDLTFYERRRYIIDYMSKRAMITDIGDWAEKHDDYLSINLYREFA
ncbi:MAG: 4Fe-4S binding protein, partial [Spirochaetales bacterium]|nr:4Fe-4S binding protein [Spirochaetales bacterium]